MCSVKGVLYDSYMTSPEAARSAFYHDITHANPDGHDLIADVLISYIMSQICMGWGDAAGPLVRRAEPRFRSESEGSTGGPSLLGGVGLRKGMLGDPGDGDSADRALLTGTLACAPLSGGYTTDLPISRSLGRSSPSASAQAT